jgi:hypothetical protein
MAELTRAARTKILLAVAGGSAVVVMGGLAITFDDGATLNAPPVASPIMPGPMTEGGTATTTIPPSVLDTEKAVPLVKAPRYGKH